MSYDGRTHAQSYKPDDEKKNEGKKKLKTVINSIAFEINLQYV